MTNEDTSSRTVWTLCPIHGSCSFSDCAKHPSIENIVDGGFDVCFFWNRLGISYSQQWWLVGNFLMKIFRIDQKEMIKSIFAIRFANSLFWEYLEPRPRDQCPKSHLCRKTLGVEERGGYYDESGALRRYGPYLAVLSLAMDKAQQLYKKMRFTCREKIKGFLNVWRNRTRRFEKIFHSWPIYKSGKVQW